MKLVAAEWLQKTVVVETFTQVEQKVTGRNMPLIMLNHLLRVIWTGSAIFILHFLTLSLVCRFKHVFLSVYWAKQEVERARLFIEVELNTTLLLVIVYMT